MIFLYVVAVDSAFKNCMQRIWSIANAVLTNVTEADNPADIGTKDVDNATFERTA
jgi:hypothetical protein